MDTTPGKRPRPVSPTSQDSPSNSILSDATSTRSQQGPAGGIGGGGGGGGGAGGGLSSASTSFRNVSACNRCRLRKNRCDQNLPACSACAKAGVKCVGYDPITKREIPRAYVYYLETRVSYLEEQLTANGISFAPSDDFEAGIKRSGDADSPDSSAADRATQDGALNDAEEKKKKKQQEESDRISKLVSNIGLVSVQGASDPRFLGSTSGISFARVVFAAVRNSISGSTSDRAGLRPGKPPPSVGVTAASSGNNSNFRDSFFGLQSKPSFRKAPFPEKSIGLRLVELYFEHANPQIPILHRGDFMSLFERAYATEDSKRTPRELYLLNIVFAIGAGSILGEPPMEPRPRLPVDEEEAPSPKSKRFRFTGSMIGSAQSQPEEYHSSAMVHLEYFLSSSTAGDRPDGFGGSLEELQAVLLLASFALLRPVAPGLWYIVGVAMRLGVDLGLHYEDGSSVEDAAPGLPRQDPAVASQMGHRPSVVDPRERGRREWVRDMRRRLWWCVYSFDRLVSTCVGRPFGITDQVITTEFPSLLDDSFITSHGFTHIPHQDTTPSYKRVSHHFFRYRLLQSEILQVLQYRQTKQARDKGRNRTNHFMLTKMRSPFLEAFGSFRLWRMDIDKRLWEWKESSPTQRATGSKYDVHFLELNYWQAIIILYRQSLSVPPELDGEISPSSEIGSPLEKYIEEEDDEDVFVKVAEAGQQVLKLYYLLNKEHLVSYTFLSTHQLFMAGIAFLYAVWHSITVRAMLSIDDVDYTVLCGVTVLRALTDKCPPADACRDAFERMAKATVHMVMSTTGFGSRGPAHHGHPSAHLGPHAASQTTSHGGPIPGAHLVHHPGHAMEQQHGGFFQAENSLGQFRLHRPRPTFDPNLRDLFPEDTPEMRGFRSLSRAVPVPVRMQSNQSPGPTSIVVPQLPGQGPPQPPMIDTTTPTSAQMSYPQSGVSPSVPPEFSSPPLSHSDASSLHSMQSGHSIPSTHTSLPQPMPTFHAPVFHQHPGHVNTGPMVGYPTSAPVPPEVLHQGLYDALGFNSDSDTMMDETSPGYVGQPGMSVGFDTEHDFNDSWAPDMFDGYWFGGPGNMGIGGADPTGMGGLNTPM